MTTSPRLGLVPLDPEFVGDPYPAYRQLRDQDPVHRVEAPPSWALSRFDDVWDAVRDHTTYSSAQGLTIHPDEIDALGLAPTIVMMDPPRQVELRRLISHGFTPRRVAALEPLVREYVRGLLDAMLERASDGEEVDLHRDFSSPIPTFTLAHLLGVPAADRLRFDPLGARADVPGRRGFRRPCPVGAGGGGGDVRLLQRPDRGTPCRPRRRPPQRTDPGGGGRGTAHRLGHPRVLLRHGGGWQ